MSNGARKQAVGRRIAQWSVSGALLAFAAGHAQAQSWIVRAQASGGNGYTGYTECGSSDGQVNCNQINGIASGSVTYTNGNTTIQAAGQWANAPNVLNGSPGNPASTAGSNAIADLSSATIRQSAGNNFAGSGTAGLLKDSLTFTLSDPNTVYALPFSYRFDGGLSGDTAGDYHPGLYAQGGLTLGFGSVSSTQSIGESGTAYYPPSVSVSANGDWTNVVLTQDMYGYSISGDVLIGGDFGNVLGFDMQSQVSCENAVGIANCDFSHTQAFNFGALPTGVSYTSASGTFLTAMSTTPAAVPEPAGWALMIGGFGLVGTGLRRSRRAAVAA